MLLNKKIYLFVFIIFSCVCLFLFVNKNNTKNDNILEPLKCDLNVQDCCYDFKGNKILVSINPKPIGSLEKTTLKITNLPDYKNPKLIIYGLNMYMGDTTPKINKISKNVYESNFILAQCTLEKMRFRAQILDGNKEEFYFDFEIKR